MDTNREDLLYRFLDELKPDCQTIINMQDSLDNAQEDKKRIDEENPKLAKDIENALTKQNELADYGKDMTSMGDKWLNLVHEFDLSFDFNIFATEAKAAFDSLEKKIENTKDKQKQNGIDLEAAEDIINFTPNKITAAIKHRENLKREIDKVINGTVEYLDPSNLKPMLKSLDTFSEEEIKKIMPALSYPEEFGFKELYENYTSGKSQGKSMGALLSEAMNNSEEEPRVVKKTPEKEENLEEELSDDYRLKVIAQKFVPDVKEEPVIINNDEKIETRKFLKEIFEIEEEDIKLKPEIEDIPLADLKIQAKKLEDAGIDPSVVRMKTLIDDDVDLVIKNIKTFKKAGYELDDKNIANHIGALDSASADKVSRAITIVDISGLTLRKPNGIIATDVVTRDPNKLRKAIQLVAEIDINYFIQNPEKMDDRIADRMARILYCQANGINYINENNEFESFIDNEKEWEETFGPQAYVDNNIIPKAKMCNGALAGIISEQSMNELNSTRGLENFLDKINITADIKDRYQNIIGILNQINQSDNDIVISIGGKSFLTASVYKNIINLLNAKVDDTDENILLGSLLYNSHNSPEIVKDLEKEIDPNTRGLR